MSCSEHGAMALISSISGGASLAAWIVAQIPQLVETYNNKSVEGLSGFFVSIWVMGDVCSFIGCLLTEQMFFQYLLAAYFLFNDFVLVGQYYYYGYYLKKKKHHHHRHHHHTHTDYESTEDMTQTPNRKSSNSAIATAARAAIPATILAAQVGQSEAAPIPDFTLLSSVPVWQQGDKLLLLGTFFAWSSASLYFFSRIPQLIKNYKRKSTEDISPFLFACTLFGNLTYTTSILFSCDFVDPATRWDFFYNELPYMIGSGGTIIFDVVYFYQLWLYSEPEQKQGENTPLLSSN